MEPYLIRTFKGSAHIIVCDNILYVTQSNTSGEDYIWLEIKYPNEEVIRFKVNTEDIEEYIQQIYRLMQG